MTRFIVVAFLVAGCVDEPAVGKTTESLTVDSYFELMPGPRIQAETSVAVVQAGVHEECPDGAVVVGYNDGTAEVSGANAGAGYQVNWQDPLDPGAWENHEGGELTAVAQAMTDVQQTIADPALATDWNGRIYYAMLASAAPTGGLVLDRIVLFKSDECGADGTWSAESFDPGSYVDRPYVRIDDENRLWIAYKNLSDDRLEFTIYTEEGGFTEPRPVPTTDSGGDHRNPTLANLNDVMFMVWAEAAGNTYTWHIGWTPNLGEDWSIGADILTADIKPVVGSGQNNKPRAAFVIGSNAHCIVAVPAVSEEDGKQRIRVLSSDDGSYWTDVYETGPVDGEEGDAFLPALARNRFASAGTPDHHLVLTWYDTRDDPTGGLWDVYTVSSTYNDLSWDTVERTARPGEGPFEARTGYFGDYIEGGALMVEPGAPAWYLFAWMEDETPQLHASWIVPTP